MNSIKNKAVRVRVTVGKQSGYVRDDSMNRDLEGTYGASGRSVVHKKLFKTSRLFKEVQSAYTTLYNHYKDNSLPWEPGARVIPSTRVLDFANEINSSNVFASYITMPADPCNNGSKLNTAVFESNSFLILLHSSFE